MVRFTEHFKDQWAQRCSGPLPTPDQVEAWLNDEDTKFILQFRDRLFTARGRRVKQLAIYWVWKENLILKVDEGWGESVHRVVTVITPATQKSDLVHKEEFHAAERAAVCQ